MRQTIARLSVVLYVGVLASGAATAQAPTDWPSFRGSQARGVGEGATPPESFSGVDGTNLAWRVEIPGLAHASPIVWGNRVYVTSAVSEAPPQRFFAEIPDSRESVHDDTPHRWVVTALDKVTGEVLWQRTAVESVPATGRLRKGTFNNATPATDGEHIVALFGSQGLFCYDVDGNLLWQVDLGTLDAGWFFDPTVQWGTASSPIIHDGKVIVQVDVFGGAFIAAYDVGDGRELWRTPRDEVPSWSTPTVVTGPGVAELVTNGGRAIRAYDPSTGAELWRLSSGSEIAVPTPVFADGLIFVGSGYLPSRTFYAVRPGGSGDISPPEGRAAGDRVAWSKPEVGPLLSTPLVVGNYLYLLARDGTLSCFDAATGLPMYRERVVPEPDAEPAPDALSDEGDEELAAADPSAPVTFSASPVTAAGKLYVASEAGEVFVIEGGPFLRIIATNPVGEAVFATPAISGNHLFVRGLRHLYAFAR